MMFETLDNLDRSITLAINGWNSPAGDAMWSTVTHMTVWIPFYLLLAFMMYRNLGWKKFLAVMLTIGVSFFLCERCANFVKHLVQRPRPLWDDDMIASGLNVLASKGGKYGFFSGHACNTFCVATAAYMGMVHYSRKDWKPLGAVLFLWATVIAASRVFVAKHYFGDVIVGAMVGMTIAWICSRLSFKIFPET